MRNATLCILIRDNPGREVLLAMKKRGFGAGKWNGVGGKVQEGETIEQAAIRETQEEIGVTMFESHKVAEMAFNFPAKPEWAQTVHVFLVTKWQGEPSESEEMAPQWFAPDTIPYPQMWDGDHLWWPLVLAGKKLKGKFTFADDKLSGEPKIEILSSDVAF